MVTTYNLPPDPDQLTPSVDDSLSPSDGYFNDRSPVPQQIFIPEPSRNAEDSKGKEKERERELERQQYRQENHDTGFHDPLDQSSVDDELSPTDGFRSQSRVPDSVFVPEPSRNADNGKARERDTHRDQWSPPNNADNRSYTPYTPTSSTSTGSLGTRYRDEDDVLESSPLLDSVPPPNYEAATAGQRNRPSQPQNGGYTDMPPAERTEHNQDMSAMQNDFNALDMGPPDVFRRGGNVAPQSMRGGRSLHGYEDLNGRRRRRCCRWPSLKFDRKTIKRVLLILLVISVVGGILCGTIGNGQNSFNESCPTAHHSITRKFEFDSPKSFTFEHDIIDLASVHTTGHVSVKRAQPSQKSPIVVELDLKSTEKNILNNKRLISTSPTSLTVAPKSIQSKTHWGASQPCLAIAATISVLPGTTLQHLLLLVPSLSLTLASDLSLTVRNATKISSTSSPITFPPSFSHNESHVFTSRSTHIHLTSGSITGTYPLRDILSLSTTSGSIAVNVIPEAADPNLPNTPATFIASAKSGSINVNFPRFHSIIPKRAYITEITSRSGSVGGHYIHGAETSIFTSSGSVHASFIPISAPNATTSTLMTSTSSGSQNVQLTPLVGGANLTGLVARHESRGSGSMNLRYPPQWDGTVKAQMGGSGGINLSGRGLQIIREDKREKVAVKGDEGASEVLCDSRGSGTINFQVDY